MEVLKIKDGSLCGHLHLAPDTSIIISPTSSSYTVGANKTQYPHIVPAPPPHIVPALPPWRTVIGCHRFPGLWLVCPGGSAGTCPLTTPWPGGGAGTMYLHCPGVVRVHCGHGKILANPHHYSRQIWNYSRHDSLMARICLVFDIMTSRAHRKGLKLHS